jgi:hypothetical protein
LEEKEQIDDLKPMNIREAIEVSKIVCQHAHRLAGIERPVKMLAELLRAISEDDPTDGLRLIAYMYHEDIDTVVEALFDKETGFYLSKLAHGFTINPLPDLVRMGAILGFVKAEQNG